MSDPESRPSAKLFRARPLRPLRSFPRGVRLISVDERHIVVGVRKGSLEVLNQAGKLLRTLDVRVSDVTAAALAGRRVVVQRGRSLFVYDIRTGRREKTLSIQRGRLADFDRGLVVYVTDTAVRLVRLADGHDVVLSTPTKGSGEGPLHAELEAPGLFYSFVNYKMAKPGRVVFVPFGTLKNRLR